MIRLSLLAALVAACSSPAKPAASPTPGGSDNHGAVCAIGSRHANTSDAPAPVECSAGLQCCYPCGIDGCDDVCMTPEECNEKRP